MEREASMVSYLDYAEYLELGGTVSADAFPNLERKAQRWLDSFTFNRIQKINPVPDVVKEVLTEYIGVLSDYGNQSSSGEIIENYSNGVETIKYRRSTDEEIKKKLNTIAADWLPDYLVCRSVKFDVEAYLQPEGNNP